MEIILIKPVRAVGRIGDLVKVKNGFGRNYLIPQNLAVRATEANKQLIESKKAEFEAKNLQARIIADTNSQLIAGQEIMLVKTSSGDGRLFGSITNKEIAAALTKLCSYNVSHSNVLLEGSIKSVGVFTVQIMLHAEVTVSVIVAVGRSEAEASKALEEYKAAKEAAENPAPLAAEIV